MSIKKGVLVLAALLAGILLSFKYGLLIEIVCSDADIGIPGVRTCYAYRLRNFTALPITFEGIDFGDGYAMSGTWYHYRVEKWAEADERWVTVAEINPKMVRNNPVVVTRVWPGGALYPLHCEATAARDEFRKGDLARFVVFSSLDPADDPGQKVIRSPSFRITEERLSRSFTQ